jgi:type III secretion system chaperone SycN
MSVDSAIAEFGRSMGMGQLAFNDHGVVRLRFERTGALSIEHHGETTLIGLARPLDRFRDGVLERALALCHFDRADRLRPDAGVTPDGALVFSVRLDDKVLDLPTLESAFDLLCRLHDRAAG